MRAALDSSRVQGERDCFTLTGGFMGFIEQVHGAVDAALAAGFGHIETSAGKSPLKDWTLCWHFGMTGVRVRFDQSRPSINIEGVGDNEGYASVFPVCA